jgi:hypothetical protein
MNSPKPLWVASKAAEKVAQETKREAGKALKFNERL